MSRTATCDRNTKETQIHIELNIDGTGQYNIDTGVGFFDHMLEGFARHGLLFCPLFLFYIHSLIIPF